MRRARVHVRTPLLLSFAVVGILALVCGPTLTAQDGPDADALTNEDIVRRFVTGTPEADLIALIHASRVAFDVSEEMVVELGLAGIPSDLLDAMVERQAAQDAADNPGSNTATETAPAIDDGPAGEPTLTVVLNDSDKKGTDDGDGEPERDKLRMLDAPRPELNEFLGVRDPAARITDIALFLGCRTADHVPDQWRSKTPLGRDFAGTPRHRMLLFIGGAEPTEAGKLAGIWAAPEGDTPPAILELVVPESISTPLEADVVHDLSLGIAVQVGGRYYLVVRDDLDNIMLGAELPGTRDGNGRLRAVVATPRDPKAFDPIARFESTQLEPW